MGRSLLQVGLRTFKHPSHPACMRAHTHTHTHTHTLVLSHPGADGDGTWGWEGTRGWGNTAPGSPCSQNCSKGWGGRQVPKMEI